MFLWRIMLNLRLNAAERDTESQGRETIVVFQVTKFFFPELRQSNVNYRINFQIKLAHETNLFYFHVKVKSKARTSQARFNNSTLSEPCPKRPPHHRIRESDLILCNLFSVTHKKWLILLWRLTSLNSKVTKSLIGGEIQLLQLLFACC